MTVGTWIAFVFAALLIAISPGSGAVLSMTHGLSFDVKNTTATIFGLQAGLLWILFIVGAGFGSLLVASEFAFSLVKTVGALYLIYLGLNQWRATIETSFDLPTQSQAKLLVPSFRKRFLVGFFTNATNPKGIVFMVAVLPQFIDRKIPLLSQLFIIAVTMCCIDLLVMHGYAYAASLMQGLLRNARAVKIQNQFFGGILMLVGATLFFVKRSSSS